jgi:small-conductance mechanosensitive channel
MKLSKQSLILATIVPLIFGVIILLNFKTAIDILDRLEGSTHLIYDQLIIIGIFAFLALSVYWCVMMYLISLLQENLLRLDSNLDKAADIGAKHLSESKSLLNQVISILKRYESSQ